MVQLSPSPTMDITPPLERLEEGRKRQEDPVTAGSPKVGSPTGLSALQLSLEVSTAYHGYETYIEDGLICLKHKVRNLEKKKLKLEDYKKRLNQGEALNKDQMAAVEKYEEVLHNLEFARELHKTLDGLTETLLRAQKKAVKKEQVAKVEVERRRLSTVLQVQHLLHSLQQEHVRRDLLAGHNQAPQIPAKQLHSLSQLATLLGVKRDNRLSLTEQMEQAALVYLDLLEGKDIPVAGSTFKSLKEELTRLMNSRYFSCLPPPPTKTPEVLLSSTSHSISKSKTNEASKEFFNRLYLTDMETPPTQNWKEDFQGMREREPPDCWDMEFPDGPTSPHAAVHKPWRGAATFIPKVPACTKNQSDCKQRKERKARGVQNVKAVHMDMPVEIFNSLSTLPKDPVLRRQHLEDLMTKIHGSFSFMQDSLLDGDNSPTKGHPGLKRRPSGSPSPLAQTDLSPVDVLPKVMHSTPLPIRLMERKASLSSRDQCLETCDLELSSKDLPHEPLQLAEGKEFPSPPLYHREATISTPVTESGKQSPCNGVGSCTSTPPQGQTFTTPPTRRALTSAQFQNIQSVFKVNTSLPQNGELSYKPDSPVFSEPRYSTASTQTPPEFAPSEDEPQPVYQSDYTVGNGGQIFLSPGQSGGSTSRPSQSYYTKGSVRGMARGGKGLAQTFRSSGWHRGGPYIPQTHLRDCGPLLYAARDSGYQHSYRRGGGRHNSSAGWSDSSQVSSPDREGAFTIVDSGHGDSLSVSTVEVPLTPHGHHHTALLPMQVYPLSQPLRVAFTASRTANFAPGNLDQPIVFDQLHSNLGEMYDTHIGRFTCPVNGTYVFIFHILKLAINVPLYINLMRNEDVMVSAYANDGAPDHETASNHAILPLFQGDQVWLRLHRGAIYGSTWKYSTFSGFLLYQD
ncbi:caprin-2-like isoform X2 [Seriola lalandi dorsalis]|uniref:caprin-2-like isoform X2 n=1 Tax=Seriola lalandi dorsalis TaxID=1841481 RepID=UPI000C6F598C|nr:caprin-2-like isoform X2 [Seriola lalandi dorsalis]